MMAFMKKFITFTILFSLGWYIFCCTYLYVNQERLIYQIVSEKPVPKEWNVDPRLQIIDVVTEDGIQLQGWFVPPINQGNDIIVFFHGNGQHMGSTYFGVSQLLQHGYGLLMVEYRQYAGHAGLFNEEGMYKDSSAFMDYISEHYPSNDLILYGESLGSAAALEMAVQYEAKAVILLGAFSSLVDVVQRFYPYFPVRLLCHESYNNFQKVEKVSEPILFLHGQLDSVVPIRFARKLYDTTPGYKKIIDFPQGNHVNLYGFGAVSHVVDFLSGIDSRNEDNDAMQ